MFFEYRIKEGEEVQLHPPCPPALRTLRHSQPAATPAHASRDTLPRVRARHQSN